MGDYDRGEMQNDGPLERYQSKFLIEKGLPELNSIKIPFHIVKIHFGYDLIQHTPEKIHHIQREINQFVESSGERILVFIIGCTVHWTTYVLEHTGTTVNEFYFDSEGFDQLNRTEYDQLVEDFNEQRVQRGLETMQLFQMSARTQYAKDIQTLITLL